jgi:hypothetical protein
MKDLTTHSPFAIRHYFLSSPITQTTPPMKKHLTFSLALLTFICSTVTAQLPSYLPADGLVGWWPFNGNANDESGNGNDGVVNGATLTEDREAAPNAAYSFDGVDDNILTSISSINAPNNFNYYSVSFWFNWNNLTNSGRILQFFTGTNFSTSSSNYDILTNETSSPQGSLSVTHYGGFASQYSPSLLALNNWQNGVVVFNHLNDYFDFYLNGNFWFSGPIGANHVGAGYLSFGSIVNNTSVFSGKIDDIGIWNRALTQQEIQNLYAATNETVDTGDGAAPLPQGIPYQAAARDAQGQAIVSAPVNVRFSLHEGAVDGAVSYSETHALTTNSIGLFNTVFGNGTPEQSAFDSINWAATTKFLQVEIDLGDGYVDMGTTQLLSVPYSFRSDEAARIKNAGLPIFADNAAALAGGLVAGELYRTAAGDLKVVY